MNSPFQIEQWIIQYWENPHNQRYYRVAVEQDIFGQWVIISTWGGKIRASGRSKGRVLANREEGLRLLEQATAQRKSRHYQAMPN
jgi:predicted DNA-binding WGR domain protein